MPKGAMTVDELIKALRKFPADAVVGVSHSQDEINGEVYHVSEASDYLKQEHGVGVVIRL